MVWFVAAEAEAQREGASAAQAQSSIAAERARLRETGSLSQGVQTGRKALRVRHMHGVEVRKKRPRGFKKRPRGFK